MSLTTPDPLVSILIPAHNAAGSIAETIRSALGQTWQRKEIIVVDDGSTDETLDIVKRFASDGVSIVTQENQGAAATRNRLLSLSQGDYIQWLDADDLLAPSKIAAQMQADRDRTNRTLLSGPWGCFIFRPQHAKFVPSALWRDLTPVDWLVAKLSHNAYMQTATWLASRELTEAAGPWDTRLLGDDDGEFFCRVLLASEGVRFIPEARTYYRMPGSRSLSYIGMSDAKVEAQFRSMRLTMGYVRSLEDSPRVRAACVAYLQNWLVNFHPNRPDIVHQMSELAKELGGRLKAPRLSWKYAWIAAAFGSHAARRVQIAATQIRWSLARVWDKAMLRVTSSTGDHSL